MKRRFLFSSLAILVPFLINGIANSVDLFPMKIGKIFIYKAKDSADPPNSWNFEFRVIKKVSMCSNDYFYIQIWNNENKGEIDDYYVRSTENNIYECDTDSGVECSEFRSGTVGTTWTCEDELFQIMEPETVTVPYGGPFTAVVNRSHVEDEPDIPYWFQYLYFVPGLGWVKQVDYWYDNPPMVFELTRICYDGTADFTSDTVNGSAPLTVNFTDQSCGIITSWLWDFGDGSTSSEQNPSHTYTDLGTYTVSLTVIGPGGSDEKTEVDFISVSQRTRKAMPFIPLLLDD